MPRSVTIKCHHVEGIQDAFPVPKLALQTLFRSAGIDLLLVDGDRLAADPGVSLFRDYPALVREFSTTGRDCGHLVIGLSHPDRRKEIAGQLHDLDARGLASVYVLSTHIQRDPFANFAQTIAHEIGHMLNLSHGDVDAGFDSTMDSLSMRDQSVADCWAKAEAAARVLRKAGQEAFYMAPTMPTVCYPFAFEARRSLSLLGESRLLPWGSKFEHPADQTNLCACMA